MRAKCALVFLVLFGLGLALGAQAQISPTAPAQLNTNANTDSRDDERPQLVTDGLGNWVAVWDSNENLNGTAGLDLDIFVSRSTNNGLTWTAPALLNTTGTTDVGEDLRPTLTTDGSGNWVAVWYTNQRPGSASASDYDIVVARSANAGATWTAPALLNTNGATDSGGDEIPRIATDGVGNWVVAWESSTNLLSKGTDYDILVSRSTDNGTTWTAPALLNSYATTDNGIDSRIEIATDAAGTWVAAWATNTNIGWVGGWDFDIAVSRSTNNGLTWTTAAVLDASGTTDFREDFRPALATDRQGNWVAAWHGTGGNGADADVYVVRSSNSALTWSSAALLNSSGTTDAGDDNAVRLTTDRSGNWVAVWESTSNILPSVGFDLEVFYSRSTNNGLAWSAPAILNTDAATETNFDLVPQLATDRLGNWVAVWESAGKTGSDFDISVSRFTLAPLGLSANTITPATTGPTSATSINFTVAFSADVANFNNVADLVINHSGTSNSGVTISGGPQSYTVGVTGISGTGSFTLAVSTTSDVQSTATAAPLVSSVTSPSVTIDNTIPTVLMSSVTASTTGVNPIPVTVAFSETVTGFLVADITPGNATVGNFTGSGANYSFNLTPLGVGTVTADIAAGVANDAAGNLNTAAAQFSRVYNNTAPTVTLSSVAGDPVTGAIAVTVALSESSTNFIATDITTVNSSVSGFSGAGAAYSFTLTPTANGLFSAVVNAGTFSNSIGNLNNASNLLSRTADITAPSITLSTGAGDPVNGPITVNVVISESTTNFISTDITTANSTVSGFSGVGAAYSFTLTPTIGGAFSATVAAGAFTDAAGNNNTASNTLFRTADLTSGAGITPGTSAILNSAFGPDTGDDERPQIATNEAGAWVAIWDSNDTLGGTIGSDLDILVSRSSDNGVTWTAPAALNTNATTDAGEDWRPALATNTTGNWVAVWYSNSPGMTGGDYDILLSRSTDNGATWTAPALLNTNGTTDSGDDEIPRIATDRAGNWVAVWDSSENLGGTAGTDLDVFVARSTDNGATWTAPALANSNGTIDGADDIRTELVTNRAGVWVLAWASNANPGGVGFDYDILVSRSTNNGLTWSPVAILDPLATSDSGEDFRSTLATDGGANLVAAWHSNDTRGGTVGSDTDLFVSRSSDGGVTWSPSTLLNTNAATDSGEDEFVRINTDRVGNWIAVWDSNPNLGGVTGGDYDIFAARSTNNGLTWSEPQLFNSNGTADSGIDSVPQVDTDRLGNWVAVWESNGGLDGNGNSEYDIITGRFTIPIGLAVSSVIPANPGPTNATTANFTVTFSANTVNFNASADVIITHTGTANTGVTITGGPAVYNVAVTGISGNGSFTLRPSTVSDIQGAAGGALISSVTSAPVVIDNAAPTATLASAAPTSVNGPITVSATLTEASTNFIQTDLALVNATVSGFSGFGASYTFTLTPVAAGTFSASIPASRFTDAAGNNNTVSNTLSRTADFSGPTITLASAAASVVSGPITVTATLSQASTNFAAEDITPVNAAVSNFAGTGTAYTFTLTPTAEGVFSAQVAAGTFTDVATNANVASNVLSRTADLTRPTATLASVAGDPVGGAIAVTVVLTESSTNFVSTDVTRVNCSISGFTGAGTNYSFTLTPTVTGLFSATVNAGVFSDAAGNTNTVSNTLSRTADRTRPTMTLASTAPNPINGAIAVTATASEATANFVETDLTLVNATVSNFAGIGAAYTFTLTPIIDGTFSANALAGVFTDAVGNTNTASNTLSRTADLIAPTLTLTSGAAALVRAPIAVTVRLSQTSTNFVAGDVTTVNATVSAFSGSGRNYSFTLTPVTDGLFSATVLAGAFTDPAGNGNVASAVLSRTADLTLPVPTIASVALNPTNVSPIAVTVTFNESVTGFTSADVVRTNSTLAGFTGTGASYSFTLTPTVPGLVTADIAAGRCVDLAGNSNVAAVQFSRTYAP